MSTGDTTRLETPEGVARLFERQRARRWEIARTTAAERRAMLERLRDVILRRREELTAAVKADFGKHPSETELTEIVPTLEEIRVAVRELPRWMAPRRAPTPLTLLGTRSEIRHEPKGQVLVLSPWNYPFNLAINPVIAAVAAGNCVVLRPSEKAPRTAAVVRRIVADAFGEDHVAVVLGGREVADALLALRFDHVFFTGSPAVGRRVMAAAAKHLVPVTLELGGKSPAIVDETARVDAAAERIAWGKLINGGQTCVAPDYALVHEAVAERFVEALKAAIARLYGATEEARARNPDLARLVDAASCERLDRAIRATVASGARLVLGGAVDVAERRLAPTVLTGVTPEMAIMQEEIFGPVLPVLTFRSLDEALERVRGAEKPLALYLFSERRRNVEQVLRGTSAGGSCVNNTVLHLANPHLPFGGVGQSGMGNYHGRHGFETFSHARGVLTQGRSPLVRWLYPPYTRRVERLLAVLRRLAG